MQLFELLKPEDIVFDFPNTDKDTIIKKMVSILAKNKKIRHVRKLQDLVLEREHIGTTAIGRGLALPHVKTDLIKGIYGCVAYFPEGVEFHSLDDQLTRLVFLVLSSSDQNDTYIKIMSLATRVFGDLQTQRVIFADGDAVSAIKVITKVSPP